MDINIHQNEGNDLIVSLLQNPKNRSRITMALMISIPYQLNLDFLDFVMMYKEAQLGQWN